MGHDLRAAFRSLVASPGFFAAAVLTLALGIGANTAVFSAVNAVLLRPAPLAAFDRLVMVWEADRGSSTTREPASLPDYLDYKERARSLDAIGALAAGEVNLTPPEGEPTRVAGVRISHDILPMLGVQPLVGRTFTAAEDVPGGPDLVIISRSLWQRLYDGNPSVVGQALRLDEQPYSIIGVVPDSTDFGVLQVLSAAAYGRAFADRGEGTRADLWMPLRGDPQSLPRSTHPLFMVGRLGNAATVSSAQAEMASIAEDLERRYPENANRGVNVEAFADVVFGPVRPTLYVLWSAVALVLLVACVNVAGLLLVRGAARAQEVAVRRALGASWRRLARQFLAESLVLAGIASAAGVGLAYGGLQALVALAPAGIPRLTTAGIDLRALAATLAVSVAVAIVVSIVPTLQAGGVDLETTLKGDGGTRGAAAGTGSAGHALVVAELAFAVMLLAGAGLLIRSFWNLLQQDPGFRAESVLKAEYQLPRTRYPVNMQAWPDFPEQRAFTDALLVRVGGLPGVVAAAVAGNHPLDRGFTNSFGIVGRPAPSGGWPELSIRRVSSAYFRTVGLGLVHGRLIEPRDATTTSPVLLVNESAAGRLFPGVDASRVIGAQIRLYGAARTIVGVVADEKFHGVAEAAPIAAYLPLAQAPSTNGAGVLLVRTDGDPRTLAAPIRAAIHERDPALAVFGLEPLAATLSRSLAERRFAMLLLVSFAALALLLGAIGVYGMLSYDLARRRQEIGIRLALGAAPGSIVRLVVIRSLRLALIAVGLGTLGALALSRFLATLLFGVGPRDPATLVIVATVLACVAVGATLGPAWRAAHADPAAAMRL